MSLDAENHESRLRWRPEARRSTTVRPNLSPRRTWYARGKAVMEFTLALVLFVAFAPLILLTVCLVKLTSRGPVFYSQTRLGRNGVPFRIFKVRTMVHNCEKGSGPRWSSGHDPRITPVGRFLRKTHLDELPQLWNVLRGDMSLVGPRPERPEFVPSLEQAIPHYRDRLLVRPGVTGLAQVQLPADTDLASVRRKLAYDLYYVRHYSLWLDLRLLACTAVKVLGVPFDVLGRLFGIPTREHVERHYHSRPVEAPPVRDLQPTP
jgi:lipopolysaccharide/colanic/teichoic acid biosynthesis glycosyltransferase